MKTHRLFVWHLIILGVMIFLMALNNAGGVLFNLSILRYYHFNQM